MGIKVTRGRYKGMWCYFTGKDMCFGKHPQELGWIFLARAAGGQQKQKFKNEIEQGSS